MPWTLVQAKLQAFNKPACGPGTLRTRTRARLAFTRRRKTYEPINPYLAVRHQRAGRHESPSPPANPWNFHYPQLGQNARQLSSPSAGADNRASPIPARLERARPALSGPGNARSFRRPWFFGGGDNRRGK